MTTRLLSRVARALRALLLGALALFYLQFGLQALFQSPPQGVLTLVGAVALGWAAVRAPREWSRSALVLAGTLPLLVLHAVFTLFDPGELPFLIGSAPVPVIAGAVWLLTRSSSSGGLATEEVETAKDDSPIEKVADNT
jgi:peptidoglycan/LPS O-acetylase OafA/YrhL